MSNAKTYPINEIFGPTIQGEGHLIGTRTYFVRFAGCEFLCKWCDTLYAVRSVYLGWQKENLTANEIVSRVHALPEGASWVTLSGGNPALFIDSDLLSALDPLDLAVECQGTHLSPTWVVHPALTELTISPKPPSSGMSAWYTGEICTSIQNTIIDRTVSNQHTTLKYVIFTQEDLAWVKIFDHRMPSKADRYLSIGTPTYEPQSLTMLRDEQLNRMSDWVKRILGDPDLSHFRVLPQLHVLLWGQRRGV